MEKSFNYNSRFLLDFHSKFYYFWNCLNITYMKVLWNVLGRYMDTLRVARGIYLEKIIENISAISF